MTRVGGAKKKTAKKTQTKAPRKKKIPAKAKETSNTTATKSEKKDYKDIGMAYLAEGLSAVEKLIKQYGIKAATVRRAARHVEETYPEKSDMFRKFVEKNYPDTVRGRMAPVEGEVRDYKPQQIKNGGGPFLRLPLDMLDVKVVRDAKGGIVSKDLVCVKFTGEKIEVWKKAAG